VSNVYLSTRKFDAMTARPNSCKNSQMPQYQPSYLKRLLSVYLSYEL